MHPILLYAACALGAFGVLLALPKKKAFSPFIIGAVLAAAALGLAFVGMGLGAKKLAAGGSPALPNYHFYIFSAIALFGALRVISHPRPVYAALYFILTILASCGLYVILSAEFMAFALVIVYAGAILITYLFVIMLATEAPSNEALDMLGEYDRFSREPVFATISGFVLLAALTTVLAGGSATLKPQIAAGTIAPDPTSAAISDANLGIMPRKVREILASGTRTEVESRTETDSSGSPVTRQVSIIKPLLNEGEDLAQQDGKWAIFPKSDGTGYLVVIDKAGARRQIPQSAWPKELKVDNTEGVAFALIGGKPGAIEIAGVILLMAMLGAVVLARKKVDMDDAAKRAMLARHLVEPRVTAGSNGQVATHAHAPRVGGAA